MLTKTALTQERLPASADPRDLDQDFDDAEISDNPGAAPDGAEGPAAVGGLGGLGRGGRLGGGGFGVGGGDGFGGGGGFSRMSQQPRPDARFSQPMRTVVVKETVSRTIQVPIPPEEIAAQKKLQDAIQQLSNGKDEDSRKAAADTVQQQLTTQFEADLKQREKELAEVEQRIKSLREQLDKRKAARADIINLRLQTLVNKANGLGFPDANSGTSGGNRYNHDYVLPSEAPLYQPGTEYSADPGDRPLPRMRDPFDKTSDSIEKPR